MDSVLLIGNQDKKLGAFLGKLGYSVISPDGSKPVPQFIAQSIFDVVLIDSRIDQTAVELCEFLRSTDATRGIPIVCIPKDNLERVELKRLSLEKFELIDLPFSVGSLVARLATQLRLSKFAGRDERTASLVEVNASLRDLNARFTKEVDEARQIQESLLPESLPVDSRFTLAASYQPLTEVGGDWYYAQVEKSGKITIQIADVTGHGLSAALIGSMTKLALSAANREQPDELLKEMNRLMAPQLPEGRFVTVDSCLYDPETGKLQTARAGHPPCFVLNRASGKVTQLKAQGFPLGFMPDSDYSLMEATLEVDDAMVMITDGISEGQNRANENYGFDRLSAAFAKVPTGASAANIIESILSDFETFCDGRILKDDVTIVALKRLK